MCNKLDCPYRVNSLCRSNGNEDNIPGNCPLHKAPAMGKSEKPRVVKRDFKGKARKGR